MGVYIYKTKPSHVAMAWVKRPGEDVALEPIALYSYAYKPTWSWGGEAMNRRWHFRTGCVAAEAAYDRSGKEVPRFGVCIDEEKGMIYADSKHPFFTKGGVTIYDDYVDYSKEVEIVGWAKLPKGIKVQLDQPKDEGHVF